MSLTLCADACLDRGALNRLLRLGGESLLAEVIAIFLTDAPVWIQAVHAGVWSNDLDATERAAHSLKSAAGLLGARALEEIAERIERLASVRDGAAVAALLRDLEATFSTVKDRLPLAQISEGPTAAGADETARVKRIAIVEDNQDNRLLVRAIVEGRYEIVEYETGREAVERLADDRVHLLLLDISLPEMDGTELIRWIRTNPALRHLPVVAVTAHAMAGDRERLLAAGFDDYVTKPIVDEAVLLGAIGRWLDHGTE